MKQKHTLNQLLWEHFCYMTKEKQTSIKHSHAPKSTSEIQKTETVAASQDKPVEIKMTLGASATHLAPERQQSSSQSRMS